jgi:hypothetical protein
MKHKSIFNAVGVAAVAVIFCVGCSEDDNPPDNNITTISVNDEQVYGYSSGALESNYSCSFTNFSTYLGNSRRLADFFTNPVVSMVNGKLAVSLGEPVAGLKLVRDAFEDLNSMWDVLTISDTAKILAITEFKGECTYNSSNGVYDCNSSLMPGKLETRGITLFYADRPVTIGGNIDVCVDYDAGTGISCIPTKFPFSFNLQIGWNVVSQTWEYDDNFFSNNYALKTFTTNFSGSGGLKWEVQINPNDGSHLIVPTPTTPPIGLVKNIWTNGSITSSEIGSAVWYSFNATDGEKYYVWWENGGYTNAPTTLSVAVSIVYSGGPTIFIGNDRDHSFTADRSGTVQIRMAPAYFGSTGTFAVMYTGWDIDKRPDYP